MKPRARRIALLTAAAGCLVVGGLAFVVINRLPYWRHEAELIEMLKLKVPWELQSRPSRGSSRADWIAYEEKESKGLVTMEAQVKAVRELGAMRSVRAVPNLIAMWDELDPQDFSKELFHDRPFPSLARVSARTERVDRPARLARTQAGARRAGSVPGPGLRGVEVGRG